MAAAGVDLYEPSDEPTGFYRADEDDEHFGKHNRKGGRDSDSDEVVYRCEACSKTFKVSLCVVV